MDMYNDRVIMNIVFGSRKGSQQDIWIHGQGVGDRYNHTWKNTGQNHCHELRLLWVMLALSLHMLHYCDSHALLSGNMYSKEERP